MKSVAIVVFPDVLLLDVAGPMDVFAIANRYLTPDQAYRITTVGAECTAVRASNGLRLLADECIDSAPQAYDLLLVPGGPGAYNDIPTCLLPWLQDSASQSQHYGSICTGAFLLGYAGLLDGHRVTTHWNYTERLSRLFPAAQVETNHIYLQDRYLLTSGGVTAGIDLALSIVEADHGRQLALTVAKVILVAMKRQGGQGQFGPMLSKVAKEDTAVSRVQAYVLEHIDEAFTVKRLASLAAMSARSFARQFVRESHCTPMEFVLGARIDHARKMLETTELPMKTVAYHSGFGSDRHMRLLFTERLGLTPSQYRERFGYEI
ncbi:AraC family transcriptional regulator [Pokkaliibacter plantistimulans]|uniref:AraC family transcriptional regulator n=1 Tax=Proteobacteria bacterium 228 TaxID=2083153 RepID=A0A2S5KWU2_9PROT|nr:GlxA family transcriptional regulator [Pokkaliibacter plantistimulans]PPC79193.1 AraC family transcriptional regulator [Pokkaliibacter plantistimulans]